MGERSSVVFTAHGLLFRGFIVGATLGLCLVSLVFMEEVLTRLPMACIPRGCDDTSL